MFRLSCVLEALSTGGRYEVHLSFAWLHAICASGTDRQSCALLQCSIAECISYDRKLPMSIHLIPRPGRGQSDSQRRAQVWVNHTGTRMTPTSIRDFSFH